MLYILHVCLRSTKNECAAEDVESTTKEVQASTSFAQMRNEVDPVPAAWLGAVRAH